MIIRSALFLVCGLGLALAELSETTRCLDQASQAASLRSSLPRFAVWDQALAPVLMDAVLQDVQAVFGGQDTRPRSLWVPFPLESTHYAVEQALTGMLALQDASVASAVVGAEVWVQQRPVYTGMPAHFDKDEQVFWSNSTLHMPLVSTVTYCGDVGGPTLIVQQTLSSDMTTLTPPIPDKAALVYPKRGRHLSFQGDLFHTVRADLAQSKSVYEPHTRTTILVNWWSHPLGEGSQDPERKGRSLTWTHELAQQNGLQHAQAIPLQTAAALTPFVELSDLSKDAPGMTFHLLPLFAVVGEPAHRLGLLPFPTGEEADVRLQAANNEQSGLYLLNWAAGSVRRSAPVLDLLNPQLMQSLVDGRPKMLVFLYPEHFTGKPLESGELFGLLSKIEANLRNSYGIDLFLAEADTSAQLMQGFQLLPELSPAVVLFSSNEEGGDRLRLGVGLRPKPGGEPGDPLVGDEAMLFEMIARWQAITEWKSAVIKRMEENEDWGNVPLFSGPKGWRRNEVKSVADFDDLCVAPMHVRRQLTARGLPTACLLFLKDADEHGGDEVFDHLFTSLEGLYNRPPDRIAIQYLWAEKSAPFVAGLLEDRLPTARPDAHGSSMVLVDEEWSVVTFPGADTDVGVFYDAFGEWKIDWLNGKLAKLRL